MMEPVKIPDDMMAVGTCGACWGPVCRPANCVSGQPLKTSCIVCQAVPRPMYGMVIEMQPTEKDS